MTAPRRIIDEPAIREEIREVVERVRAAAPSYDLASGLARFEASVEGAGRVGPRGEASWLLRAKVLTLVSVLAVGGATYALVSTRGAAQTRAPVPTTPVQLPPATSTSAAGEPDVPSVSVESLPGAAGAPTASAAAAATNASVATSGSPRGSADEGAREVDHLVALRRVAASDPARAIAVAKAGHAEFPRGALFQEREVILVEALARLGRVREASEHARAFVKAYPKSPSAARMRAVEAADSR